MGEQSKIQWTDHTFNPWWGCAKVSAGCDHCYAATFASRTGLKWGKGEPRRFFTDKHWAEPLKWNVAAGKARQAARVFCASMADVFELEPALDETRLKLWALIENTPMLDWQLLTKRPQNINGMVPAKWLKAWPKNVWVGTSVENQIAAETRIPWLLKVPAQTRFLSCEPLIGPVSLTRTDGIAWAIIGGESGNGNRVMSADWARGILEQCKAAGISVFMKQMGGARDKKGMLEDLPEDLRVREFPNT